MFTTPPSVIIFAVKETSENNFEIRNKEDKNHMKKRSKLIFVGIHIFSGFVCSMIFMLLFGTLSCCPVHAAITTAAVTAAPEEQLYKTWPGNMTGFRNLTSYEDYNNLDDKEVIYDHSQNAGILYDRGRSARSIAYTADGDMILLEWFLQQPSFFYDCNLVYYDGQEETVLYSFESTSDQQLINAHILQVTNDSDSFLIWTYYSPGNAGLFQALRLDVKTKQTEIITEQNGSGFYPPACSPDGRILYFPVLDDDGDEIIRRFDNNVESAPCVLKEGDVGGDYLIPFYCDNDGNCSLKSLSGEGYVLRSGSASPEKIGCSSVNGIQANWDCTEFIIIAGEDVYFFSMDMDRALLTVMNAPEGYLTMALPDDMIFDNTPAMASSEAVSRINRYGVKTFDGTVFYQENLYDSDIYRITSFKDGIIQKLYTVPEGIWSGFRWASGQFSDMGDFVLVKNDFSRLVIKQSDRIHVIYPDGKEENRQYAIDIPNNTAFINHDMDKAIIIDKNGENGIILNLDDGTERSAEIDADPAYSQSDYPYNTFAKLQNDSADGIVYVSGGHVCFRSFDGMLTAVDSGTVLHDTDVYGVRGSVIITGFDDDSFNIFGVGDGNRLQLLNEEADK